MTTIFLFPDMFYNHIKDSRLKIPDDFEHYNYHEYPHFHVFIASHLGQMINIEALEDNANIIADIPEDEIKTITIHDLLSKGVVFGADDLA